MEENMLKASKPIQTIRIAAVQMQSVLGHIKENLEHATSLVEQAASQGAQLVALPELAASGYSLSPLVWQGGEPRDGQTIKWLGKISAKLGVYVGISFVEAEGTDCYNSYAIGAPDGRIAGLC